MQLSRKKSTNFEIFLANSIAAQLGSRLRREIIRLGQALPSGRSLGESFSMNPDARSVVQGKGPLNQPILLHGDQKVFVLTSLILRFIIQLR